MLELSPRSSAALLRLCIQKLMIELKQKGRDLNEDIGALVSQGLDARVQKALDVLRVIGNNAVHPGQIDLKDDKETAISLFQLLNAIVERCITVNKKIEVVRGFATHLTERDKKARRSVKVIFSGWLPPPHPASTPSARRRASPCRPWRRPECASRA